MDAPRTTPPSAPGRSFRIVVHPEGLPEGIAGEHVLDLDVVVIGRQEGCDLVIPHPTVSRRHTEIRRTPEGFRVVDLGSANGTWVGGARVGEAVVAPGERFRVGAVWLELLPPPKAADTTAEPVETVSPDQLAAAPPAAPKAPPAPVRPEPGPTPPAPAAPKAPTPPASRPEAPSPPPEAPPPAAPVRPEPPPPARPESAPPPARAASPPPAAEPPRPATLSGGTSIPLDLPVESTGAVRLDLIEAAAAAGASTERLEEVFKREGLEERVGGNTPFVLDGADTVWWVEEGRVEVFTVPLDRGRPAGARTHFVTVEAGDLMFGMDLERYAMGNGFLAVGSMGTILRRQSVTRLQELASDPSYAEAIGRMVDGWVTNLSRALTKEITPGPMADVTLEPSDGVELANQTTARSNRGVLWIEAVEGNLLYVGMEELVFEAESAEPAAAAHSMLLKLDDLFAAAHQQVGGGALLFPITPDTWIEATNPGTMASKVVVHTSRETAAEAPLWRGLAVFHQVLCQCEFINKKIAVVDEFNRLKTKAEYSQAARQAALREIAMVLEKPAVAAAAAAVAGDEDPIFVAARMVGEASGMTVVPHPEADRKASYEDRVSQVAKASRFRTRPVALRGDWWRSDHGPLLGRLEGTDIPIALLPKSTSSYVAVNPATGETQPVTDQLAAALDSFGFVFYPPLPDGPVTGLTLLKLGARGLTKDVWMLVAMGIALGMLGTLTPFFTGKLFDTAIPEADRSLVFQFTIALFIAAAVSSAFKIVQSIAVLRIQGKMDYKLQAAVWDRLLDLPSRFFREYSAGDLADRAAGINTIRGYIAGAGVSSILGSLSSLFYVALMFKYDWKMGLLAMGLTAVFIGFTFACNYLQLTFQRDKLKLQGKITGMVLQLIAGVGKLRVSGAENHAYRIWAHEFSQQRRIEFIIGRIQNAVQVFNAGFPVFANMAIFFTLIWLMQKAAEEGTGGGMSTGDFIAFTSAYGAFQAAMGQLSSASLDLLRVVPVFERLKPIIVTEPEIDESKSYPGKLKGGIEVSHVTFRYSDDSPMILNDLSLRIEPGDYVAFVGGSGSGKSTLMRLMLGFEKPTKGSIYYDNQDLATLDVREVRQQIGVVLQNASLSPAELYKNIIGTSSLTIDDAWEAARASGLADDIEDMPMGMHTYVSEGGGGLSGGQRQRLIIARALVRKPRILFFDEATSALDNRSQATVTESMDRLQATRIVIAHRLSTIVNANRICYLKDGKVAEQGSYEELMALKGLFYELAIRQMA